MDFTNYLVAAFAVMLKASYQALDGCSIPTAKRRVADLEAAFAEAQQQGDYDRMLRLSRELHTVGAELITAHRVRMVDT